MSGWVVQIGGVRYQGRPVSGEAVRRFQAAFRAAGEDGAKQVAAVRDLLRWAFPLSWAVLWRGDPVRKILASPLCMEYLQDFYASLPSSRSRLGPRMNGTGSTPSTVTL